MNFVVALQAEATPIINQWRLRKLSSWQPFPVFESIQSGAITRLIISGIGRTNSAAATAWLAGRTLHDSKTRPQVWLNAGIAGNLENEVGTLLTGHKITEQATGKTWYPPQLKSPLRSSDILTTDQIVTDYTPDTLHEMEASGFYNTAQRFSFSELIQCVKIVSDNKLNSVTKIDAKFATKLIADNINVLKEYSLGLQEIAQQCDQPDSQYIQEQITSTCKFSVTQQRQLQRLLQRYAVIFGQWDTLPAEIDNAKNATEILGILRDKLDHAPIGTFQ